MSNLKKDNSTFTLKKTIRTEALKRLSGSPVIMETHGGEGKLFDALYFSVANGVVFETNELKVSVLAQQRPSWRVYEADCEVAIQSGIAADVPVNYLDVDPYGDAWPTIDAFLTSERERTSELVIVVNDGLRQKLKVGAWDVHSMQSAVKRHGNKIYHIYLNVCRDLMEEKAAQAGYALDYFGGYYCGHAKQMTHYLAVLKQG